MFKLSNLKSLNNSQLHNKLDFAVAVVIIETMTLRLYNIKYSATSNINTSQGKHNNCIIKQALS